MATPSVNVPPGQDNSPIIELRRSIRRQAGRDPRTDLVWQPRFAYATAGIILAVLTVVSLPLWVVFYRMADPASNGGAGPKVADLVALSMMLMGGLVTGGAAWVIIIEMRGRVRMVDHLARASERDLRPPDVEDLLDDEVTQVLSAPPADPHPTEGDAEPARVTPIRAVAAVPKTIVVAPASSAVPATLEASGHLLHSFSRVLKAFSQLPAQVALLAVALTLYLGATLLSLR